MKTTIENLISKFEIEHKNISFTKPNTELEKFGKESLPFIFSALKNGKDFRLLTIATRIIGDSPIISSEFLGNTNEIIDIHIDFAKQKGLI